MKTLKTTFNIAVFCVVLAGISACDSYLEDDIVSPNDPAEVTPELLMANVQVATFASYCGQLTRQSLVFGGQISGTIAGSQSQEIAQYNITEISNENEWEVIWAGAVVDCKNIVREFSGESPYYAGIAQVILALNIGIATDLWGDVPFDEGGLGNDVDLKPNYESQQVVLSKMQTLLDDAIVNLSKPLEDNAFVPGADDMIFNGDVAKWLQTAWILKARYANRLSAIDPSGSATQTLSYLQSSGATDSGNDAFMIFFGGNANNQWDAFESNRQGYYRVSELFVNLLVNNNDPRTSFFLGEDDNGGYSGTPSDDPSDASTSYLGPLYASPSAPVPLVTYVEAKFLEAEAHLRASAPGPAADAHNAAVLASVLQVTGSAAPAEFEDAFASETAGTITQEKIMIQKYIALFAQIECYSDWRRTGIPTLAPNPDAILTGIPLRLPTPQSERLYNSNATVVGDPLTPVYWDQN